MIQTTLFKPFLAMQGMRTFCGTKVSMHLFAALALLATSCSKSDDTGIEGNREIRIESSGIEVASPDTKSSVTTTAALTDIYFFRKNSVNATIPDDMSGGAIAMGNRAAGATTAITWTAEQQLYTHNNDYAFLVGCWPGAGSGVTSSGTGVEWALDGKTDVLVSDRWNGGRYTEPVSTGVIFRHRLAALEVVVKAEAGSSQATMDATWGNITSIKLLNTPTKAIYAAADNGMTFTTPTTLDLKKGATYNDAFQAMAVPEEDNTEATASGLFAPSKGTFQLLVTTTSGGERTITVQLKSDSDDKDFEVGCKHTVTLRLTLPEREIVVESTGITAWDINGGQGGNIVFPPVDNRPDKGFLDWSYTGLIKTQIPSFTLSSYNGYTMESNGDKFLTLTDIYQNERPYVVLQVALSDETGTGDGWNTSSVNTGLVGGASAKDIMVTVVRANWQRAYAACKAKVDDGGGWRLPRASELQMMQRNISDLHKTPGFTAFSNLFYYNWKPPNANVSGYYAYVDHVDYNAYWSGTESAGIMVWRLQINTNKFIPENKPNYYRVRCVRERIGI